MENHVHGSGIRYRNSFLHKKLNILEYDKLFPYAEAWEEEEIVLKLALDRILYPMDLTETAEKKYIDYLHEHGEHAVGVLGKNKEYEAMQSILDKSLRTESRQKRCWSVLSDPEIPDGSAF